jgi:hypothetical protein
MYSVSFGAAIQAEDCDVLDWLLLGSQESFYLRCNVAYGSAAFLAFYRFNFTHVLVTSTW